MKVDFTVTSNAWVQALDTIQRVARAGGQSSTDMVVEFRDDGVKLMYAGTAVAVPAEGEGEGRAVFSGGYIRPLTAVAKYLGVEAVRIWAAGRELHIGTTTIACQWVKEVPPAIQLPQTPTLRELLQLRYRYSQEQLAAAGMASAVFEAECRKADILAKALDLLEPLGVTLPALDQFVRDEVKRGVKPALDYPRTAG